MPLNLTIIKSDKALISSFLKSVSKEVLRAMIQKQEYENIKKGRQDKSNYYNLKLQLASKDKLIAYYMLIKKRRITSERVRSMIEVI